MGNSLLSQEKIHSLQVMRIIAAFLVVSIHIPFHGNIGSFTIAFGKIAVPFFLVICGYFLYRESNDEFLLRIKKQFKNILYLTLISNTFYLLLSLIFSSFNGSINLFGHTYLTMENLKNLLLWNMSPFADHLWYLGSLLYALILLMAMVKLNIHKYIFFLAPILLTIYITLSRTQASQFYYVYRNALLCTLAYVMMGCMIRRYQNILLKFNLRIYILLTGLLCFTNVLEWNFYRKNISIPYFSAELLVYVIILLLLKIPNVGKNTFLEKIGGQCTLFIYIMHMAVIYLYQLIPTYKLPKMCWNLAPILIFLITLLISILWTTIKQHIIANIC